MSRPHGACAFCGSTANKMSKQHIVPDQIQKLVPRTGGFTSNVSERISYDQRGQLSLIVPGFKIKPGHPGVHKSRTVCVPCNTGWMNDTENDAIPLVADLIRSGDAVSLSAEAQFKLALWASLMFVMADSVAESIIPETDRTYIYEHRGPPPLWQMFLGVHHGNKAWRYRTVRHYGVSLPEGAIPTKGMPNNTGTILMGIGHLVFFLAANQVEPFFPSPAKFGNDRGLLLIPSLTRFNTERLPVLSDFQMLGLAHFFDSYARGGR